jgi:DNA processing protein
MASPVSPNNQSTASESVSSDSKINSKLSSSAFNQPDHHQTTENQVKPIQLTDKELVDLLALKAADGIGPSIANKLLSYFGNPSTVMSATENELKASGLSNKLVSALKAVDYQQFDATFEWLQKPLRSVIPLGTHYYPPLLAQTATPPLALFTIGNIEHLLTPQIAVVGSRSPTPQGLANTQLLCQQLANEGMTITSGLALGIDGEAHRTALANNGYTIAVTGSGLSRVYPACHKKLAHTIADRGLLVSECLPDEKISAGSFPKRNRIIAGLSLGTLVIEAAIKSGSLITARIAMEESREVFAVPGSINNPLAAGCHSLIRQGATLVEKSQDILQELPSLASAQRFSSPMKQRPALNQQAEEFLKHVDYETTSLDLIMMRTQLPLESVTNMLLLLELDGWVTNTTGGYIRL